MAAPAPLLLIAQAIADLGPSLPPNRLALQDCINTASQIIQRWAKRDYSQNDYVEVLNSRGFSAIQTRQYPINSITRLATSPTPVLQVTNTSASVTRATVNFATTGDVYSGQTITGLTLNSWNNGAKTTQTVAFTANETIASVASSINALNATGWSATALAPYTNWPASDFIPGLGAQACAGNTLADLNIHTQDCTDYSYDPLTGQIRFNNQTFDPIFALMNLNAYPIMNTFPPGWQSIRVEYNAGYTTVPPPIVQAALITTKALIQELQTVTSFAEEEVDKWKYKLASFDERALPESAKRLISDFGRSFRGF